MKKISFVFLWLLTACSSAVIVDGCPKITTLREASRQYVNNGNYDALQITLSGHDSYCYTQGANGQRYMVITPYFKIRRLEETSINAADVTFYVKTVGKGNYIGTKVYPQSLSLSPDTREQIVKGKSVSLRIAQPPYDDFAIETGLALSDYAKAKTNQMFDIDYRYLSNQELNAVDEPITQEFLEIGANEKVVYCEKTGKPMVVKKSFKSSPCN